LYALQATIPGLTPSSVHRCFQRHGIRRLPDMTGTKAAKKKFKPYSIGYFHIDSTEVHTEAEKLDLFVAIDRTSKFAYAELVPQAGKLEAAAFLRQIIATVPCRIHTVLIDNGIQFTHRKRDRYAFTHIFARVCHDHGIDHRLTKPNHPWTNGQVERMNRTLKEATVKRYHDSSHQALKDHLYTFLNAYNFAKRLKTLQGLTPYAFIISWWQREPERFRVNPANHIVVLNT
jgi:IS30 family transposase